MNRKKRKSSRIRMESRLRGRSEGPTIVYDQDVPPRAFACNRAGRRQFKKSGLDHTAVPMEQLRMAGQGSDNKPIYFMGDKHFIPPYLWRRVKQKKPKGKSA